MPRVENSQQATDAVVALLEQHFSRGGCPVSARPDNGIRLLDILPREASQNAR
jgi:hypothetical protein